MTLESDLQLFWNSYKPILQAFKDSSPNVSEQDLTLIYQKLYLPAEWQAVSVKQFSDLYNLENIDFVITAFSLEQEETNFFLEDWEYDNFRTGKVELNLEENIGRMVLIVNGDTAFSDSVGDLDTVSIQKSYFKKGTNSVIFSGRENSKFAGRARIRITYVDTRENSARLDFNLTQSQYNNFPRGRIVFDVIDVQKSGGLQVRVSNGNEVLLNEFQSVGEGKITVWINKRDVLPGINKIEIKSVDGAVFAIENFKIEF